MHFLLVNQNPAVSRLITLSVKKLGFEIYETTSFDDFPLESYDMVFVDNELYDEKAIDDMMESGFSRHFCYIASKGEDMPSNMHYVLKKPFLPTDFIDLVAKIELEEVDENLDSITDDIETSREIAINLEDDDTNVMDLDDIEPDTIQDISLDDSEQEKPSEETKENAQDEELLDFEDELESILDSDDIDEVKQLLEDSDEDDDLELGDEELEESSSKEENEDFSLDKLEGDKEDELEDELEEVLKDEEIEGLDDEFEEDLSFDELEEDEESEQETLTDSSFDQEESLEPEISSLDDLSENALLAVLGKKEVVCDAGKSTDEKDELEKDVEKKVSQSIMEALEESSIKEALKGMKINVSVTFEEEEK